MKFCLGQCGYDLYAEIHLNYYNQLLHGLFMPFVVYGSFVALAAVLNYEFMPSAKLLYGVYGAYFVYYLSFDPAGALMSFSWYMLPVLLAIDTRVVTNDRWLKVAKGAGWLFAAVGIQELFGHTFFEETNSDLLQFPNSVLNAPLFGARAIFHSV